jgi:hypothetical protein
MLVWMLTFATLELSALLMSASGGRKRVIRRDYAASPLIVNHLRDA